MTDQERAANDLYILRAKVAGVEQRLEALAPVLERAADALERIASCLSTLIAINGQLSTLAALKIEEMQQAESRHDHIIAAATKAQRDRAEGSND